LRMFAMRDPALPAIRAWLSARASAFTHTTARSMHANGEVPDPRVPAWASEMIAALPNDSVIDRYTVALAGNPTAIIPLSRFFTMDWPGLDQAIAQRGG